MFWEIQKFTAEQDGRLYCHFLILEEVEEEQAQPEGGVRLVTIERGVLQTQVAVAPGATEAEVIEAIEARVREEEDTRSRRVPVHLEALRGRRGGGRP